MVARASLPAVTLLLIALSFGCSGSGPEPVDLLIVDLNVLHGIGGADGAYERFPERIELIAAALAELQPDVVFLQEVLAQGGEDYPDVRSVLLSTLGEEYTAVFGDITGLPIDEGALGQMTLTRLPVLSAENHHISGPRSIHRVTVQTERGPLHLFNAHLEGAGAVTEVGPEAPLDEIANVLAFVASAGEGPAILAGDFNAEPQEPSISAMLDAGFIDALAVAGDATCRTEGDPGCTSSTRPLSDNPENLASRRIDYVFVLNGEERSVTVEQADLFLNAPQPVADGLLWPSDHIGVRALLTVE